MIWEIVGCYLEEASYDCAINDNEVEPNLDDENVIIDRSGVHLL